MPTFRLEPKNKRAPLALEMPVCLLQPFDADLFGLWPPPAIAPVEGSLLTFLVALQIALFFFLMTSQLCAISKLVALKTLVAFQIALLFFLMTFDGVAIVTIIPVRILRARCLGQSQHQR